MAGGPVIITPPEYSENLLKGPALLAPDDGYVIPLDFKTGGTPAVEFKWKHNTEANGYDLWIAADANFTQSVLQQSLRPPNVMSPSWTLIAKNSPLQPGNTYYWKVRVNRVAGTYQKAEGQWSEAMTFSLAAKYVPETPKQVPVVSSPEDNAVLPVGTIDFVWESIPGATSYRLTLSGNEEMSDIIADVSTPAASLRYTGQLEKGKTYYWNVAVVEPYAGEASPVFSFIMNGEQPQPTSTLIPEIPIWIYIAGGVVITLAIILPIVIIRLTGKKKK
jgi:hypothetical protein